MENSNPSSSANGNATTTADPNVNTNVNTNVRNTKQQQIVLDKETKEQIQKALDEIHQKNAQQQALIPQGGSFIKFSADGEHKRLAFTGKFKKQTMSRKDFKTGAVLEGKFSDVYYFECHDITSTDPNNKSGLSIWQRGTRDANIILSWFSKGYLILDVTRRGIPGSNLTNYEIFPVLEQVQ